MNPKSVLGRRNIMLMAASMAAPSLARSQPVLPQTPAPIRPILPLTAPSVVSRPPAPAATAIDKSKIYYIFFDQPLNIPNTHALRRQITVLVEAGVGEINLVLSSPGGLLLPVLGLYSLIRALPAQINTHAQGFVASAATVLFLAGENRSADRNAHFLFHPAQSTVLGAVSQQQMQDELAQFNDIEAEVGGIYHDRTKLSDSDIKQFQQQTVVFDAEKAQKYDIVQTVADLRIEGGQRARILFIE